jgi:hypothetical protein
MTNLTPIFIAVIAIASAAISIFLIPLLKVKFSQQELDTMRQWAAIAVQAAQQLYYDLDGEVRLSHAMAIMRQNGYDVDSDLVRAMLEAEVLKLHQELEDNNGDSE